jgi:monoterpene epsilon-lactone hydrolase
VPVVNIDTEGSDPSRVVLHFHGGVYVLGSARAAAGLAAALGRQAGVRTTAVDYRLAPEHPYPAAIDDAVAVYRALLEQTPRSQIALSGESAGGGLAIALLLKLKEAGLPLPASAVLFSPWVDLALGGTSMATKASVDPSVLSPEGLRLRVPDYVGDSDPTNPLISPIFADLSGLPPLLIQAGTYEILLDDAVRLAAQAAAHDVEVTLQVTPEVPHVFQAFSAILDEGETALRSAGSFLRMHFEHTDQHEER